MRLKILLVSLSIFISQSLLAQTTEIFKVIPSIGLNERVIYADTIHNRMLFVSTVEKYQNSNEKFLFTVVRMYDNDLNLVWEKFLDIDSVNLLYNLNISNTWIADSNIYLNGKCYDDFGSEYSFIIILNDKGDVLFKQILNYTRNKGFATFILNDSTLFVYQYSNIVGNYWKYKIYKHNIFLSYSDSTYDSVLLNMPISYAINTSILSIKFIKNTIEKLSVIFEIRDINLNLLKRDSLNTNIKLIDNQIALKSFNSIKNKGFLFRVQFKSPNNNPNIPGLENDNAIIIFDQNFNLKSIFHSNKIDSTSYPIYSGIFNFSSIANRLFIVNAIEVNSNQTSFYRIQSLVDSTLEWQYFFNLSSYRTPSSDYGRSLNVINNQLLFISTLASYDIEFRNISLNGNYLGIRVDSLSKVGLFPKLQKSLFHNSKLFFFGDFINSNGDKDIFIKRIHIDPMGFQSENINTLKLYPNPSSDRVYLDLPVDNLKHRFEFYNTNGQLVKTGELENSIDVSDLENGVYVLKVGCLVGKVVVSR